MIFSKLPLVAGSIMKHATDIYIYHNNFFSVLNLQDVPLIRPALHLTELPDERFISWLASCTCKSDNMFSTFNCTNFWLRMNKK